MRTLKFKVIEKSSGKLLGIVDFHILANKNYTGFIIGDPLGPIPHEAKYFKYDDLIFLQYTGMNDKNGKEIYEGDYVLAYGEKWKIIFSQGSFWAIKGFCGGTRRAIRDMYCEII